MADDAGPGLDDLADGLAEELADVDRAVAGDVTSYKRTGTVFARVSASMIEVRLPDDIAEAALRAADTAAVPDERGWVRFSPAADEPLAVDRTQAWFRTAWRHAAET